MIEALKSDEMAEKMGGRFKLTALIQKRWVELLQGARPLTETPTTSQMELIVQEIVEGKITIEDPGDASGSDDGA